MVRQNTSKVIHDGSSGFHKTQNIMGSCWRIPRLRSALSCPVLTNQGCAYALTFPTTRRLGYGSMRTATRAVSNRASCSVQVSDDKIGTKVHVVTESSFPQWLEEQTAPRRSWLESIGYEPSKHVTAALPGDPPMIGSGVEYVATVKDLDDVWNVAGLVGQVPPGRYSLAPFGNVGCRWEDQAVLSWMLESYSFDAYKVPKKDASQPVLLVKNSAEVSEGRAMALAICMARDLINTPAQDMTPAALSQAAVELVEMHPGAVARVVSGEQLLHEDSYFPAVHAVGRAADCPPHIIDIRWQPPESAETRDFPLLTLVGKGVTFDSGGLDIKPASGMRLMKKDMGGAALMLALAQLIMGAGLPVKLRVLIPAAENAVGAGAFRPGDVLATRGGKTVEVDNTDAEGRLLLADALFAACEEEPDLVLDAATLTGAARVALGPDVPAIFSNDEGVADELRKLSTSINDPLWPLPLHTPYAQELKSGIADLLNCASSGLGGAITAALFLKEFVSEAPTTTWVHVDTMGWNSKGRPGRPQGGEALGLRALWAFVERRYGTPGQK